METAYNMLIAQGLKHQRIMEIMGIEKEQKREAQKRLYKKNTPKRITEPWRCVVCGKKIQINECLYCRDRKSFKEIRNMKREACMENKQ